MNPNDFIIKDNIFIRNFEEMYKNFKDGWSYSVTSYISVFIALFFIKGRKILDLGAGIGKSTRYLVKFGDVTATDISPTAVKKGRKMVPEADWVVDDIRVFREEWKEKFDTICLFECLYYVAPEIETSLLNLRQYLKKKGRIVFTYYFPYDAWTRRYISSSRKLRSILEKYFKIVEFIEIKSDTRQLIGVMKRK